MKSPCLDPQLLSDYALLHYKYKYDWLHPALEEIVAAYMELYDKEKRESDIDSRSVSLQSLNPSISRIFLGAPFRRRLQRHLQL